MGELLTLLSGPLAKTTHSTILSWLRKRGDCVVAKALLRTLPMSVHDAAVLGSVMEATLTSVFNDRKWLLVCIDFTVTVILFLNKILVYFLLIIFSHVFQRKW